LVSITAPARNEARDHGLVKTPLPFRAQARHFHRCQAARHAPAHVVGGLLVALGVFLQQHVQRDRLLVHQYMGLLKFHAKSPVRRLPL
jgi:hypothetical protein